MTLWRKFSIAQLIFTCLTTVTLIENRTSIMTYDFTGKVVIVTGKFVDVSIFGFDICLHWIFPGSSSGIGENAIVQFAKFGAQVVVTGRNAERVNVVVNKCDEVSPTKLKVNK